MESIRWNLLGNWVEDYRRYAASPDQSSLDIEVRRVLRVEAYQVKRALLPQSS